MDGYQWQADRCECCMTPLGRDGGKLCPACERLIDEQLVWVRRSRDVALRQAREQQAEMRREAGVVA